MYLLGKNAASLKPEDIIRLVENQIAETKSLDYKKDLSYASDGQKKEFLFDIIAMANTEGACLVYGIEEAKDVKSQNTGCLRILPESTDVIRIK